MNMERRPFAYCCAAAGGHVEACDCVNKDHGFALFSTKATEPAGDVEEAFLRLCEEIGIPATAVAYLEYRGRMAEPVGEAKAIIDELNACYLYGVSEKSDALAKRIIAHLSRPAEPAGEVPHKALPDLSDEDHPAWIVKTALEEAYRVEWVDVDADGAVRFLDSEAQGGAVEHRIDFTRPTTPTNPERRERGAEPTDAETAAAARRALGTWLSWPDAARDGVPAVDNGKVCSWLQGVPSRLAALSAAPLKGGDGK